MKYKDVTSEYIDYKEYSVEKQSYFIDNKGIKYEVDGKYVIIKPTKRELEVAELIGKAIGGKINIIPKVNKPLGMKTPDYIVNNEKFDLKEITGKGKYVIEGNLRKKKEQANNFIIDITKSQIDVKDVERQLKSIYISSRYWWIDKIFLIHDRNILKVYQRE